MLRTSLGKQCLHATIDKTWYYHVLRMTVCILLKSTYCFELFHNAKEVTIMHGTFLKKVFNAFWGWSRWAKLWIYQIYAEFGETFIIYMSEIHRYLIILFRQHQCKYISRTDCIEITFKLLLTWPRTQGWISLYYIIDIIPLTTMYLFMYIRSLRHEKIYDYSIL